MDKSHTLLRIKEQQRRWADARNIQRDGDSVVTLEFNLYQPLTPLTRAEYERGDGDELGRDERRGKMFALRSSSALVCNVFDYWRGRTSLEIWKLNLAERDVFNQVRQRSLCAVEGCHTLRTNRSIGRT